MRVKKHSDVTAWNFMMIDPEGKEISVPAIPAPTITRMMDVVMSMIEAYDAATEGEYSKEQRRLAEEYNKDHKENKSFRDYVAMVAEHQLCLRMKGRVECWNNGYGDKIHNKMVKVDSYVEKATPVVRRALQMAVAKITPTKSRTLGGCTTCGGTFSFNPQVDNLGRAGKLNKLGGREG